jgi:hypothetical protein
LAPKAIPTSFVSLLKWEWIEPLLPLIIWLERHGVPYGTQWQQAGETFAVGTLIRSQNHQSSLRLVFLSTLVRLPGMVFAGDTSRGVMRAGSTFGRVVSTLFGRAGCTLSGSLA